MIAAHPTPGTSAGPPTPPPSVPLTFMGAAGAGLVAFGLALALAAPEATSSHLFPEVIATAHLGVLAFLSTAVLGAVHQFGPVAANRALRSVWAARATASLFIPAVWMLPFAFATGRPQLVSAAGVAATVAVGVAAWNLSGPLSARGGGLPVAGLRVSVTLLVVTVLFGVVFALDRHEGWFPLDPRLVAAHAHLGLLGWLGGTYFAVAEKLWPMFMLAHRPRAVAGRWAIGLLGAGAPALALGLLSSSRWLIGLAAVALVASAGAHLTSLAGAIRARRRPLEMLHVFILLSAGALVTAVGFGVAALLSGGGQRFHLVRVEVIALIGWLALAVVGHAHKVVPFISFLKVRAAGVQTNAAGKPLSFADLFSSRVAYVTLALLATGVAFSIVGMATTLPSLLGAGGLCLSAAGASALWNLGLGPVRALDRRVVRAVPGSAS